MNIQSKVEGRKYKKVIFLLNAFVFFYFQGFAQQYVIYNTSGEVVSFEQMTQTLSTKNIVFFGELHDNVVAHKLEFELTSALYKTNKLILGAEMIETDNQQALDAYLKDSIDQRGFDTLARLWNNYHTDYKPLVDFAKEHQLTFVATNIPRRYAKLVNRNGFEALDTLPSSDKKWIAPLPISFDPELPRYKNILTMMGNHATPNLVKAQAVKDATMAHFILTNYTSGYTFLHFNGSYHSNYYEGIVWYVRQQNPSLRIGTISTVTQKNIRKLKKEYKGSADFIITIIE